MDQPVLKAVFITFNQALTEKVEYMLDHLGLRGFTQWDGITGRGSVSGEPHLGTHTWPEINGAVLTMVPEEKVERLLQDVKAIDEINTKVGIRAFVWDVSQTV